MVEVVLMGKYWLTHDGDDVLSFDDSIYQIYVMSILWDPLKHKVLSSLMRSCSVLMSICTDQSYRLVRHLRMLWA